MTSGTVFIALSVEPSSSGRVAVGRGAGRSWRPLAAAAAICLAWILASPASAPAVEAPEAQPTGTLTLFPSADEISTALGVGVELRGIDDGLSQLWEGMEVDWPELQRAQLAIYASPEAESEAPQAGVIIDIAEFESEDQAVANVDDRVLADEPSDLETDLIGDFVRGSTFGSDDGMTGSFIFVREGPLVVSVSVVAFGGHDIEGAGETIVRLVQDRLHSEAGTPG